MKFPFLLILLSFSLGLFAQKPISPYWEFESNIPYSYLGKISGVCGDLNGDGYPELFSNIGDKNFYIFLGNPDGYGTNPDHFGSVNFNNNIGDYTYGDLNNDGYHDLIISSRLDGKVLIYYGSPTGIKSIPDQALIADIEDSYFGSSVDATGDINNDGINDLLVGQPLFDHGFDVYGKALIYLGRNTGISTKPDQEFTTRIGTLAYGSKVRFAGDVNGDGYDDVMISAGRNYFVTQLSTEFSELFLGGKNGLNAVPVWSINGIPYSMEKAGDINGDGYDDFIFTFYDQYHEYYNRELYTGNAGGLNSIPVYNDYASSGKAVGIGDFNDDGFDDVVMDDSEKSGSDVVISIYLGSISGLKVDPGYSHIYKDSYPRNRSFFFTGDVNNDGYDDFLLTKIRFSSGETEEGKIELFKGKPSLLVEFTVDTLENCISNNNFSFKNTSANGAVSFNWDFGDGNTSTLENPSHSFSLPGMYTVSLTVTDTLGHLITEKKENYINVRDFAPGGHYTLGPSNADFYKISEVNHFLTCGISGDVDIAVENGFYDDGVLTLNHTPENSERFVTKIYSQNNNPSTTAISSILINDYKNVQITGINLYNRIARHSNSLVIKKSENVIIDSCHIHKQEENGFIIVDSSINITLKELYIASSRDSSLTDWLYTGNRILVSNSKDIKIDSNFIYLNNGHALFVENSTEISIRNNRIYGLKQIKDNKAIRLDSSSNIILSSNTAQNVNYGFLFNNCTGKNLIFNNLIGGSIGQDNGFGMKMNNCLNTKIIHNTINYTCPDYKNSSGYHIGIINSENIHVKNNLFNTDNDNIGPVVLSSDTLNIVIVDYNAYSGYSNKEAFKETYKNSLGPNAIVENITFVSEFDLLPDSNKVALNEAALFLNEAPYDKNGKPRGSNTTDMGAYEIDDDTLFFAGAYNIELVELLNDTLQDGYNTISVAFSNQRDLPVDSIYFSYKIDDKPIITELWTGNIDFKDTLIYNFNNRFESPKGRVYDIKTWITLPTSKPEYLLYNNVIQRELYQKMKGVYTIYGENPDFPDLITANLHLGKCTSDSMVVFEIRPGLHEEYDFYIENGPVTLRSSTGNAEDVIIKIKSTKSYFIRNDNITLKNLTIYFAVDGTYYGYQNAIAQSKNIWIDSCIFTSSVRPQTNKAVWGLKVYEETEGVKISNCKFNNLEQAIILGVQKYVNYYYRGILEISNCTFDSCQYGVYMNNIVPSFLDAILLKNNYFKNGESFIYLENSTHYLQKAIIQNNYIESSEFFIKGEYGRDISNSEIINNKIFCKDLIDNVGFRSSLNFYNNMVVSETINIVSRDSSITKIYNNSFSGAAYITGNFTESINNNFYADSVIPLTVKPGYYGRNNNIYRKDAGPLVKFSISWFNYIEFFDLDSVFQYGGYEKYSVSVDPEYIGNNDLHSKSNFLNGKGIPLPEVISDIDGEPRDSQYPDIGADEIDSDVTINISDPPYIDSILPQNGSVGVPIDTVFTIVFNKGVLYFDGEISVKMLDEDSLSGTINLASEYVKRIDSNIIQIEIPYLSKNTGYYLTFEKEMFISDRSGNEPINDPLFYNFYTESGKPLVKTQSPYVNLPEATLRGLVEADSGAAITERGICWNNVGEPLLSDSVIVSDSGIGSFSATLYDLEPGLKYYYRAYAINSVGVSYGNVYVFRVPSPNGAHTFLKNQVINLYPNPASEKLVLSINGSYNGNIQVKIYSSSGILVFENQYRVPSGGLMEELNVRNLSSGMYTVQVISQKNIYSEGVIIE